MRIHDCDLGELAQRMGNCVSLDEARYMRDRLVDLQYSDTEDVPENVWLGVCRQAAEFARSRNGA